MSEQMTVDTIVAVDDVVFDAVSVPQWNGKVVNLGSLTAFEMFQYFEERDTIIGTLEKRLSGIRLVCRCLIDNPQDRNRIGVVPDPERPDRVIPNPVLIEALKQKNPDAVALLTSRALQLNGFKKKDALEEAKNVLGETPSGVSPSDSQKTSNERLM